MFKILKHVAKKEWLLAFFSLAFIVAQVWLDLETPEYMGRITELVQTEGSNINSILTQGGIMLLITLASVVTAIIVAYFAAAIASNLSERLRGRVFDKVQSFSMEEINRFSVSSLITRSTNDIVQVQTLVIIGFQIIIKSPILVVWAIIKIMEHNWQWTVTTAAFVGLLFAIAGIFITIAIPKFRVIQKQIDDINRISRENITGIRVIRAYNAEKYQEEKFEKANVALMKNSLFINRLMTTLMPSAEIIMNGLTLSIYWIGAALIASASLGSRLTLFTEMMMLSSYAMQLLMAFMMLIFTFILIPRASVSARRINEVLGTAATITDGKAKPASTDKTGEVEFRNVCFKYPDSEEFVIKDISFKASMGETVAIIGSTGSGKSTILNLIPRFHDATIGEVLVNGINVKDYTCRALRDKIGYVAQKATLFGGSIASNISFGDNGRGKMTEAVLTSAVETAQATDFVQAIQGRIGGFVSPGGTNLSGGQKQRISIARAIARQPEILMFDDSFSALDYKTDRALRRELKRNSRKMTILIVAQRIGTIKEADRIVVIEDGLMAGCGTHKELMESCEVYKEIAYSQLSKEELSK